MSPRSRSARGMLVGIVTMTLMATESPAEMATHDCLRLTDDGGWRLKKMARRMMMTYGRWYRMETAWREWNPFCMNDKRRGC